MKESMRYLKRYFTEAWDIAKLQWRSFLVAMTIVGTIYCVSLFVAPGWISYLVIFPPSLIIALTALARVNDIGPERMGLRWQFRKISLIMAGAGAVMFMATPFMLTPSFPTWRAVIIVWGVAGSWLTTVGQPPWEYYITGKYRFLTHSPDRPRSPLERFAMSMTKPMTPEELMKAQAEYEEEQSRLQRGAGEW